jgi:hypothetical protein
MKLFQKLVHAIEQDVKKIFLRKKTEDRPLLFSTVER